ncbi:TonB-dependent receptor [Sphingomonas canadensis]|uniref:TonB-dependent receptor n=1 Tax=Sphingomonas canadensis TaxID=1219257 RepID=A0ABW3H8K2_9SPHN|nr:TonB-dependent receptor [Sphingomonas canadensis]MCW3837533.1 TonB-dependent receptor [Sphingomonas canadensis]
MKSVLLATVAAAALALPAHAQEAQEDSGEIVVTGQRAQQERAIDLKRDAIGVIDVAAADEIGRLPDRNVAEVVERLPGVGVTYDQGEGRYVAVRGVPSDLNNYTVNGIEVGNPDGTTRSLPLDVISGQLLNRVEIAKAKTADMDGQGIGGSINLVTQTAFDFDKPFNLLLNGQVGYQELNKKAPVRGDASVAGRFGSDEQFGLMLGMSYSDRTYASYGLYPDDWRTVAGAARGGLPTNIKYTDYSLHRERIGATGSLDWRPSDDHQFYVRGIWSKFTEDEYRQRYRLDFATAALVGTPAFTMNPDGLTGTVTGTANVGTGAGTGPERRQDLRQEYKEKSILAGMVGGSSTFGAIKADWTIARVHNEVYEPNQLWQFRCNPGTVDFDFTEKVFSAKPRTECATSQLNFRQYTEQLESGEEDIWQGRLDLTWTLDGLDAGSFVKAGAKFRATDKSFDAANDTWTRGSSANRFTLQQFGLAGDTVSVYPRNGDTPYSNGPTIDIDAIRTFTAANLSSAMFVKDAATSLSNATLNDMNIDEDVTALYAMANLRFGVVTVTPGLRYEHTGGTITGFRLETPLGGSASVVPDSRDIGYNDWLPSLIVRVDATPEVVVRLAYTKSMGRPNYNQLSPGGNLSYEPGTLPGTFEGSYSAGNPDLKPYRAHNLDGSLEWYFQRGGLVSIGAFAKFIDNPIFTNAYSMTNVTFAGRQYDVLGFSQPLNADKGEIYGIEVAYQQQFTFLPGLLSGFGVELNATLTDSSLDLPNGRSSTFPSQSKYLYGAQLFYQKGIVEASVAYHNTGYSLLSVAVAGTAEQDQYNDDLRRLDAKFSIAVLPNVTLFAEAQNLTDEPTRQYQWNRDHTGWVTQNERYGRTFYAGVSAKF